jgi:hypothetical protein
MIDDFLRIECSDAKIILAAARYVLITCEVKSGQLIWVSGFCVV